MTSNSNDGDKKFDLQEVMDRLKGPQRRLGELLVGFGVLTVNMVKELDSTGNVKPETLAEFVNAMGEMVWMCGGVEVCNSIEDGQEESSLIKVVH
jgi:hypothetical protein